MPEATDEVTAEEHMVRFRKLPIEYKIASSVPEAMRSDVHEGFQAWNRALQREVFVFAGLKKLKEDQLDPSYTFDENVVLATQREGNAFHGEGENPGPLARTFLKGVKDIVDADIYLFDFEKNFMTGTDEYGDVYSVKSVVMHEAGHMLFGPEHSDDEHSIMTAGLYPKGHPAEKLALGDGDVEKFNQIYGQ